MPFLNIPGNEYSEPVDWHPDPVYVVHGGSPSGGQTYWHPSYLAGSLPLDAESIGLLTRPDISRASGLFFREFGGSYPSDDPECGFHNAVRHGRSFDNSPWEGFCPGFIFGSFEDESGSNNDGSQWSIANNARFGASGGNQEVSIFADISGWQLKPWELYSGFDNPWMDDDDLADEFDAATEASRPSGEGWTVDWEDFHPYFDGLEFAPDEPYSHSGSYAGSSYWITDPFGWGYQYEGGTTFGFFGGAYPRSASSSPLAIYGGGEEGWQAVPSEWLPTVSQNFVSVSFVEPSTAAARAAATIPITLAHSGLVDGDVTSGPEGTTTSEGRFRQVLAFRVNWRTPRFRWVRESTGIPPRRIFQRSDAATHGAQRVLGGGNTVQRGNRTLGGILHAA